MVIQPVPCLAGNTNGPVYTAPACRLMVSPGVALSSAACKSCPAATSIVLPVETILVVGTCSLGNAGGTTTELEPVGPVAGLLGVLPAVAPESLEWHEGVTNAETETAAMMMAINGLIIPIPDIEFPPC